MKLNHIYILLFIIMVNMVTKLIVFVLYHIRSFSNNQSKKTEEIVETKGIYIIDKPYIVQ
jgi:hypothetical protein